MDTKSKGASLAEVEAEPGRHVASWCIHEYNNFPWWTLMMLHCRMGETIPNFGDVSLTQLLPEEVDDQFF